MTANKHGFTLVEIMLVVLIIAMLGATAAAWHLRARERSQSVLCGQIRQQVESAEDRYVLGEGDHSSALQDLVIAGYLKNLDGCPAGGEFAWVEYAEDSALYHSMIACSVHGIGGTAEDDDDDDPSAPGRRRVKPVDPRRRQIDGPDPPQPRGRNSPQR